MSRPATTDGTHFVDTVLRVRYAETDRMGIVYHAHYIVWFEIGRTEFCRAAGLPYRTMEEQGLLILVTRVDCAFRQSARYDDTVRVRTRLQRLSRRGLSFNYEIAGPGERPLAEGSSHHIFSDVSGKPVRAPGEMVETLDRFRGRKT